MTGFAYLDGQLRADAVPLAEIAAAVGTPVYVYSASAMRRRLAAFQAAFQGQRALFCYALKANNRLAVVRTLAAAGAGAEVVSGGEIRRALAAGVAPERIVYAGIAKGDADIRLALETGILQLNVESVPELARIAAIAASLGRTAPVAIRVNPDVAAATHDKISTGRRHDKFGLPWTAAHEVYALARRLPGVAPVGLHLHIGSQIVDTAPFEAAYGRAVALFRELRAAGIPLRRLDLGGGFGVRYDTETPLPPEELARLVRRLTDGLDAELLFEPGRALVAEAGVLVAGVVYVKETEERRFLILDAGMNVLLRPALYGASHPILPVRQPAAESPLVATDVVGPICESSDVFARGRALPPLGPGELIAIGSAGAYGAVMASDYNSFRSAAEVLVDGDRFAVIKPGRPPERQFDDESIPDWLGATAVAAGTARGEGPAHDRG
ncbi:MAG TPA: diaminopimelate decarboxylase [Geminicoccaceae bacterium]|nr:diaminopimelate decarboxylase [Geminicoccaceae bacterium]